MRKAVKIWVVYLILLLICSLILRKLNILHYINPVKDSRTALLNPMMVLTIVGGFISLSILVSSRSLRIFSLVYLCLWIFRFAALYLADKIGVVTIFGNTYHFEVIIPNYYSTVSRLATPLPFIVFWLIHYLFVQIGLFSDIQAVKKSNSDQS